MRFRLCVALAVICIASAACEEMVTLPAQAVPVVLNITPDPVPALTVGQTVQLVAIVSGTTNQGASWSSSNNVVATVSQLGTVVCVGPGVATITAVSAADAGARDAVAVACAGSPVSILVAPTALTFMHTVGSSPCPQAIGSVQVTNTSSVDVQVTLTGHSALSADIVSFTLSPGASRSVAISFNCSTQTSFTGNVTFTATVGSATAAASVVVTGTITN